jgi:S-adenosylmethionine hydrolase
MVGTREVASLRSNYAEGAPGEIFGILGSMGFLEIAANRASAAQLAGVGKGTEVIVTMGGAAAAGTGA